MPFEYGKPYVTAMIIVVTYIPIIIISTTQYCAYRSLQKSSEQFGMDERRARVMRRVFNKFIVVIVVFFVLTTPLSVLILFYYWHDIEYLAKHFDHIDYLYEVFRLLMTINSSVNPLIYEGLGEKVACFFNSNFRKRNNEGSEHIALKET